jgi:mannose-6-phosphate isomerase-like protein (cupin superfamily)
MRHKIIEIVCWNARDPETPLEDAMRPTSPLLQSRLAASLFLLASPVLSQNVEPHPQTIPLRCEQGDCPLLKGYPQTAGIRIGFVRLKPGETVGWRTTASQEESLVILDGKGKALSDGEAGQPFVAPALVYIPPSTRHNVENTGKQPLVYIYVVAPVVEKKDRKTGAKGQMP